MKKGKIGRVLLKIVVLVLVFAGAFVVSTRILNQENGTTSEEMCIRDRSNRMMPGSKA